MKTLGIPQRIRIRRSFRFLGRSLGHERNAKKVKSSGGGSNLQKVSKQAKITGSSTNLDIINLNQ
jgi:hypothetical protein